MKAAILAAVFLLVVPSLALANLSIDDVLYLTKAGIGDEVIIAEIQASGQLFRLDAEEIVELRREGVSEAVITALIRTAEGGPSEPGSDLRIAEHPSTSIIVTGMSAWAWPPCWDWGFLVYYDPVWSPVWYSPVFCDYWAWTDWGWWYDWGWRRPWVRTHVWKDRPRVRIYRKVAREAYHTRVRRARNAGNPSVLIKTRRARKPVPLKSRIRNSHRMREFAEVLKKDFKRKPKVSLKPTRSSFSKRKTRMAPERGRSGSSFKRTEKSPRRAR